MIDSSSKLYDNSVWPNGAQTRQPGSKARLLRRRRNGRRQRRVEVLFTDEEYAELVEGARRAGWSVAAWTAVSGLAAARLVIEGPWTAPDS